MQPEKYPANWTQIAQRVKEKAGWKCAVCKHYNTPSEGYTLTVHHIDGNPGNNQRWNLLAACQRCHLKLDGVRRARERQKVDLRMGQLFLFGGG